MELFAYIDPGTGSALIQAIIGAVLAGLFIIRNSLRHLIMRIRALPGRKNGKAATAVKPETKEAQKVEKAETKDKRNDDK